VGEAEITAEILGKNQAAIIKPDFRPMIFATSSIAAGFLLRFSNQYHSTALVKFRQMSVRLRSLRFGNGP